MVFARELVDGAWKLGEYVLPRVSKYTYLGVDFTSTGAWDVHIKNVLDNGRRKIHELHSVINPRRACAARVRQLVCVCVSVCLPATILALQATKRLMSDINSFSGTWARKIIC